MRAPAPQRAAEPVSTAAGSGSLAGVVLDDSSSGVSDPQQTRSAEPSSYVAPSARVSYRGAPPFRDPGRYEILGEHGRGGLGRVSRVHDKDLGRDIAVKELLKRGHVNELRFA